jgi:hypothetical protein
MKAKKNYPVKSKALLSDKGFLSMAFSALKAEAVENGSTRLTIFYMDGKPTGFTTGHSRSRKAVAGGGNGE